MFQSKAAAALAFLAVAGLLVASALAVHYRFQATRYRQDCADALVRLESMKAALEASNNEATGGDAVGRAPAMRDRPETGAPVSRQAPGFPPSVTNEAAPGAGMPDARRPDRGGRLGRREDWMENLRTNDPQRYAELQQRREAFQQNMQNAWTQASNYFRNRDTSKMSPADQEEYSAMINLLGQVSALNRQLESGLPPEVRQEVMSNLRSNVAAVVPLLENERNREYYDAALAMGHNEQEAATLVGYINQITSNTSLRVILPGVRIGRTRDGGLPGAGRFQP